MARRIPIRRKLAAALAIPIAALLVVAGLEVLQSTRDAAEVKDQTDLATASVGPSGVISSIQDERNFASLWLLNQEKVVEVPVKSFEEAKQRTDAAIADFRSDVESKGGEVVETYGPALAALDGLTELRQQVDTFQGERSLDNTPVSDPNFVGYTDIIAGLFEANTQVALAIDDPVLRRGVELSDLASRQTDVIARTIREQPARQLPGDRRSLGHLQPGARLRGTGAVARCRRVRTGDPPPLGGERRHGVHSPGAEDARRGARSGPGR